MEYPKINSLWKRQDYVKGLPKGSHGPLIVGEYSDPEFENVKKWLVDEKIDGTNIRIHFQNNIKFKGRTDNAQIPPHLLDALENLFPFEKMAEVFPLDENGMYQNVILFGEGYGPKMQPGGGNYRKDAGFVLFDVWANNWWIKRDDVKDIADKLCISVVPHIGRMIEEEIVDFVKSKPLSRCSETPQMMEGVVCRSDPLMLFRNGKPIIWKLKCKEFS